MIVDPGASKEPLRFCAERDMKYRGARESGAYHPVQATETCQKGGISAADMAWPQKAVQAPSGVDGGWVWSDRRGIGVLRGSGEQSCVGVG